MSVVKSNALQIGQSATAANNFTLYQPASPDGTVRLGVGNAGATSSDVLVANSSGNVGIGTTSPAGKLHVNGSVSNIVGVFDKGTTLQAGVQLKNSAQTYTTYVDINNNGTNWLATYDTTNAALVDVYVPGASAYRAFYTVGSERMRLDASGNLLVGTTSYTTGRLVVQAKDQSYGGIQVVQNGGSAVSWTQNVDSLGGYTWAKNSSDFWYAGRSGSANCVSVSGSWVNSSDERLKKNIQSLSDCLSKVLQLRGVSFERKINGAKEVGLIAQEVQKVFPEAVENGDDYLGLNYGALIGPIVAAIQELSAQVTTLQAEINELKGKTA